MLKLLIVIGCLCLSGCMLGTSIMPPTERIKQASQLAKTAGWKEHTIHTTLFVLKAYGPLIQTKNDSLIIYIEGDGLAWLSVDRPSDNPTPQVPIGLKMAIHNKNPSTVYLARPCQFVLNQAWIGCRRAYWTNLRFSPEVIYSMNQAIDYLKHYYHAKRILLVGYSGGGTIGALIAAKRADVTRLITVAAMLDTKQWAQQESLTPLYGSLNPADSWKDLRSIPQTHWIGGKDTVVSKDVTLAFANHFPPEERPTVRLVPAFDHVCCWATNWAPF